jgi:tetratricopeptide (TPR) repeat protein
MWRQGGQNDQMFAEWAEASEHLGDSNAVMMAYEAYAGSNELSASMLVNWGRLLKSSDQPDRALVCFSEAIRREPTEPNAYFNCGDLLFEVGAYADAAHLYENALRLQPNHITGWFVLGNALYQLGLKEAALKAYEQALALDGGFEPAEANRAVVLNELQGEDAAA